MKHYPIGMTNGVLEKKHVKQIGASIWTFAWFIDKQTSLNGVVLRGKSINIKQISDDLGLSYHTVRLHIDNLLKYQYLRRERKSDGYSYCIRKAKKRYRKGYTPQGLTNSDCHNNGTHDCHNTGTHKAGLEDKTLNILQGIKRQRTRVLQARAGTIYGHQKPGPSDVNDNPPVVLSGKNGAEAEQINSTDLANVMTTFRARFSDKVCKIKSPTLAEWAGKWLGQFKAADIIKAISETTMPDDSKIWEIQEELFRRVENIIDSRKTEKAKQARIAEERKFHEQEAEVTAEEKKKRAEALWAPLRKKENGHKVKEKTLENKS